MHARQLRKPRVGTRIDVEPDDLSGVWIFGRSLVGGYYFPGGGWFDVEGAPGPAG
jgi:hypothetical protein